MKTFVKTNHGLVPYTSADIEWFDKLKIATIVHGEFKKVRNPRFHRKFFALLNLGYEYWEPGEIDTKWGVPQKNFDTFRENITVLAGYGEPVFNIDGTFKMQAQSISFAKMDENEFKKVYDKVLTVLMDRILVDMPRQEVENLAEKFLSFA